MPKLNFVSTISINQALIKLFKNLNSHFMQNQSYENYKKFTPLHHFVQLPLNIFLTVWFTYEAISNVDKSVQKIWIGLALIGFATLIMSILMRMHYGLVLQNRIIKTEMRYRYYRLTQKYFEEFEKQFTFGQISALRFACDEELIALVEKTLAEKLSPDAIKRQIKNWHGDYARV